MNNVPVWHLGEVLDLRPGGRGIFFMDVRVPVHVKEVKPGQFAMLRPHRGFPYFLPRPLSLLSVSPGVARFLFKIVGKGTALMSTLSPGSLMEISLPLGRPFPSPSELYDEHGSEGAPMLVGGGVGIPPMAFYRQRWEGTLIMGAPSLNSAPRLEIPYTLATDDGSAGFHGNAVELAASLCVKERPSALLTCGPLPMMRAVAHLADSLSIPCYVSLESPMACGIGVCHGCAWPTPHGDYVKVCSEGPVFSTEEVVL